MYIEYELRIVDAWGNETDGYEYNETHIIEQGIILSDEATAEDAMSIFMRICFTAPDIARQYFKVYDDGDLYELQDATTYKPEYVLVPTGKTYADNELSIEPIETNGYTSYNITAKGE